MRFNLLENNAPFRRFKQPQQPHRLQEGNRFKMASTSGLNVSP